MVGQNGEQCMEMLDSNIDLTLDKHSYYSGQTVDNGEIMKVHLKLQPAAG